REAPSEALEAALVRVARHEPRVHAFLHLDAQRARAEAAAWDRRYAAGEDLPPLAGVPVALKDNLCTRDAPTTCGSRILEGWRPPYDATVVARLRAAGAIVLGKTNMDEFAMGSSTEHSAFGPTRNPWDLDRVPGGSSGGSAAAVAAGFVPLALGSDTGGSIRLPAGFCGVVGLKPTYGRVSRYGLVAFASSLDQVGPLARDVEDCALLLQAMAGYDPSDPHSENVPAPDFTAGMRDGVRGLRIGVPSNHFFENCDPEVANAVEAAAKTFERLGATLTSVAVPEAATAAAHNGAILISDAAAFHRERLEGARDAFGADVLWLLDIGAKTPATAYALALDFRRSFRRWLERELFASVDLLLHPTTPIPAPPIAEGGAATNTLIQNTSPWNLAGVPVLALPCGFTASGLPIGTSLVAAFWDEATLVRAGYAYQQATDWLLRIPSL
ncbi:MAG: Asp-tRNA(Asn)/Glu-tRNA(Gln) amidotransferase subunit GatA, partial [Dehalococcoidia bacterium]|nr:Asp-tRNA(Asn)/Glu-tRNA(Gln) amidotransferase subunit GatA [Dehalococcoidia bacterium]